eukprot:gene17838-18066_t
MATFGQPVTVTPTKSQPGAAAYLSRGVFDMQQQSVMLEDGSELASTKRTLGIRLADYPVPPRQGDFLTLGSDNYQVDSFTADGQGGAELVLKTLSGYKLFSREPAPDLAAEDLPRVAVFILSENLVPDGDANAGEPKFEATTTIGISVVRGFTDPATLDGQIDTDVDAIENLLLTDSTFIGWGAGVPVPFESISGITRRRQYPQNGETYFLELRLEIQFLTRVSYAPVINDLLTEIDVTVKPDDLSATPVLAKFMLPTS